MQPVLARTVSEPIPHFLYPEIVLVLAGFVGVKVAESLEHMMLAQYYGRDSYGSILGTFGPIHTFGLGLGPTLGALFRDAFGSYNYLYIVLFGFYLAAALCAFFAGIPRRPERSFTELVPRNSG